MFACEVVEKAAKPSDIEALAEKLEPALAKAVRELLTDHVASINLDDLEDALKTGQSYRVLEIIGSVDPVKAAAVREGLQNSVWAGGALAANGPVLGEARFAFSRLNPALVSWLETYSLNLIRDIEDSTRAAVRVALVEGMTAGKSPIDQARQIKQVVGLTERDAKSVANYRRELETFHLKRSAKSWGLGNERSKQSGLEVFRVDAKGRPADGIEARRLRDQRYDGKLKRAMESRKPLKPEEIDKMVERYQARTIQNRARNIARTESLRATAAGVNDAWRQAIDERKIDGDRVRKFWLKSKDERLCHRCDAIAKAVPKRGLRLSQLFDDPVGKTPMMLPPAHPSCRCAPLYKLLEPEQLAEVAKATADGRPNAHQRGYTRQWENARAEYLKTHTKCDCGARATVVDHVTPHRGDTAKFWNKRNWQALCETCHNRKTGRGR